MDGGAQMDEMISLLKYIAIELQELNATIKDLKGSGVFNSISDICDKLDEIQDKLYDIESEIE